MKRRTVLQVLALLPATHALPSLAASGAIQVFKNPDCGCCGEWVKHVEAAGFTAKVTPVADTAAVRKRFGMPERFGSCHTAIVGDYVLEGHVPATDVKRLLAERPAALGLAVPGMPVNSPGMEVRGAPAQPFDVILVDRGGNGTVYAHHPKG
jgi:hypothetical protein